MKLRIQGNSIRIRLTKTEVAAISTGKTVIQFTSFSSRVKFISSIQASLDTLAPAAAFNDAHLNVALPLQQVRHWAQSDAVSIEVEQPISDSESLSLLIEKDFGCLHGRQDNTDAFPNARAQEAK